MPDRATAARERGSEPPPRRGGRLASQIERISQGAAWLVLGFALVLSVVMWSWSGRHAADELADSMRSRADEVALRLQARIRTYAVVLRGAAGMFAAERMPDRAAWSRYVAQLGMAEALPGLHGLGFAARVLPDERAGFERAVRAEGFPQFSIVPAGTREWMSAILYLEPFEGSNLRAFGFDMLSNPTRRAAMMNAASAGVPVLSAPVRLLQQADADGQRGVLLYYPVYRPGMPLRTERERLAALRGWVYCPLVVPDFLRAAIDADPADLGLSVYDLDSNRAAETVYAADSTGGSAPGAVRIDRPLSVAGRNWVLRFDADAFQAERDRLAVTPRMVLGFGAVASLLLFTLVWSMATTRDRALAIARDITRQLTDVNNALESRVAARTQMLQQANDRLVRQIDKRRSAERARRQALARERALNSRLQAISAFAVDMTAPEPIGDKLSTLAAAARELLDGVAARVRYASAADGAVHESGDGRDDWWTVRPGPGAGVARTEAPIFDGDGVRRGRIVVLRRDDRPFGRDDDLVLEHFALLAGAALSVRESFESQLMARRHAEQSSRIKDQLLSVVSHELRTPLAAMKGWVHVLAQSDGEQAFAPGRGQAVEALSRSVDAQRAMIEHLIDAASVLAGRFELDRAACDAGALMRAAYGRAQPLAAEKQVRLSLDGDQGLGEIDADAARLGQVFDHLIGNALKFTPAGGEIRMRAQGDDAAIRFEVCDSGEGIDAEAIPFLFERFWMADPSTTRRVGGIGVGLSLVKAIVEAHGGRVQASSAGRGQGSCLTLELPRRRASL